MASPIPGERPGTHPPSRPVGGTYLAYAWIMDVWPPRLGDNTFLLFAPPSLWCQQTHTGPNGANEVPVGSRQSRQSPKNGSGGLSGHLLTHRDKACVSQCEACQQGSGEFLGRGGKWVIHKKRLLACSLHSFQRTRIFGSACGHPRKKKKNHFTVQVAPMGGLTTELNPGQWGVSLRVTHVAASGTFFKR